MAYNLTIVRNDLMNLQANVDNTLEILHDSYLKINKQ